MKPNRLVQFNKSFWNFAELVSSGGQPSLALGHVEYAVGRPWVSALGHDEQTQPMAKPWKTFGCYLLGVSKNRGIPKMDGL